VANGEGLAGVTDLRHWSTPSYTRVVLSVARPVSFTTKVMVTDDQQEKPRRLYLDLKGARVTPEAAKPLAIGDGLLRSARAEQLAPDMVRLALDIQSLGSYKVFTLDNPFRVVVDCFAIASPAASAQVASLPGQSKAKPHLEPPPAKAPPGRKLPRGQAQQQPDELGLATQLGLRVKRVVLDPGHGGKDPGASFRGLVEKDLALDVAKRAAPRIAKQLGAEVLLTRSRDVFVPLEDRIAFANTHDADLFVSIHLNASPSPRLNGVETYFLNLATDEESMRVAARENATTKRSISDLQTILNDLMLNSKINESNRLARLVHRDLLSCLRSQFKVQDLKVKQAPFYVLIGARMPAVLTEVGFLTNPQDHQRLANPAYRDQLAEGLAQGLAAYARHLKTPNQASLQR
jgi:N-acetylmuramoyl-L-alanine amidase